MRRRPQLAPVLGVLYAALAVGCTGLFRSTARPEQVYYLRAPAPEGAPSEVGAAGNAPSADRGAGRSAASGTADQSGAAPGTHRGLGTSLRIGHPVADPGLDSTHIMLVQADHRLNFYAGSRWPGPVADMVEALAVETLRSSGAWSSVEDSTSPFPSEYLLQVAVRRFEADYTVGGASPEVHVMLDCIIGRREGREVIASFVASGSARAAANRLSDVIDAFEQAADEALRALSREAAQAVQAARGTARSAARPEPDISRARR